MLRLVACEPETTTRQRKSFCGPLSADSKFRALRPKVLNCFEASIRLRRAAAAVKSMDRDSIALYRIETASKGRESGVTRRSVTLRVARVQNSKSKTINDEP